MTFTVPGYQADRLIGYGSHAEVWSGHSVATAEAVALKRIILPAHADPDRAVELIGAARTEAALLTALEHPSLIRLREYVQTPAAVVLVMELAEGGSLAQLLHRRGLLSPAEVAAALSPVAAALAFAHSEGVLHGDVSAANILFTGTGQPKLADLGVARMLTGHTSTPRSLGTPAYLDPVIAAGGAAGTASDVFSLAAVALHCLTGAGPWHTGEATDLQAVLDRAATATIDDLAGRLAGCPEAMAAVLTRALDSQPHRRGSAADFALDLGASAPLAPVVLTAGRIEPGVTQPGRTLPTVGRHSVDRHERVGLGAVPSDLTHVARVQVRPEPAEPVTGRRSRRWPTTQVALRVPALVLTTVVLGIAVLALATVRGQHRADVSADPRTAPSAAAGLPDARGNPQGSETITPVSPARLPATERTRPAESAQARTAHGGTSGVGSDGVAPEAVLEKLAARRAEAFARNRPDLLAAVYQSPALLAQDLNQLSSRVPAGCGLTGMHTTYHGITVTKADPQRLELRVTAGQSPASLVCAGVVRSRTQPAVQVRLAVGLVRVGTEFRIASQRPAG